MIDRLIDLCYSLPINQRGNKRILDTRVVTIPLGYSDFCTYFAVCYELDLQYMVKEEWELWWSDFLATKKLKDKVQALDALDMEYRGEVLTEALCKSIYYEYDEHVKHLSAVKESILSDLGKIEQVHLQCGRVKNKSSLIEKIIVKRYSNISSTTSGYAHIDDTNYHKIITDLVGIRLIINYRGKWLDIHKQILRRYPLKDIALYESCEQLPHSHGETMLAQIPIVYYAKGDDISQYKSQNLQTKVHKRGYRSIHYIISIDNVYVELQVRTIYDEAWSDCDHNYVYKQESNPNNRVLTMLSNVLCELTNTANDIGDNMYDIFNGNGLRVVKDGKWYASKSTIDFYKRMLENLQHTVAEFEKFNNLLVEEEN